MDSKVSEKDMREVYFQAFGKEYDSADRKQAPLPLEIAYLVALKKLKREGKYAGGGEITNDTYYESVNHFIYFCLNYPRNFLDAFGSLKNHLSNKFKDYYNKYGTYGVMIQFYAELDAENRRVLTDYSLKNYKGTPINSDISEVEYFNSVNHFIFFCFNFPSNFMDAFSSHLKVHISSKWTNAYEKKGSVGAMIYFWSELDNENRKKLANWVKANYTGTKLYEVGGALGDVAGMLPSPLPMSTIQAMANGGSVKINFSSTKTNGSLVKSTNFENGLFIWINKLSNIYKEEYKYGVYNASDGRKIVLFKTLEDAEIFYEQSIKRLERESSISNTFSKDSFADGGSTGKEAIAIGGQIELFADGGGVENRFENNYKEKTEGEIWDKIWTLDQKYHFLHDHVNQIGFDEEFYNERPKTTKRIQGSNGGEIGFRFNQIDEIVKMKSYDLPRYVKFNLQHHIREGQYANGGGVKSDYYIFEGVDNLNGKPLYRVESTSESENEYVGEWHTNRNDAEKELNSLSKKHTQSLGVVKVIFENPEYNYTTNVGVNVTEEEARNYFVGKMFNVGIYPKENMQKAIDIEFSKSKEKYEDGGGVKSAFDSKQEFLKGKTEPERIEDLKKEVSKHNWSRNELNENSGIVKTFSEIYKLEKNRVAFIFNKYQKKYSNGGGVKSDYYIFEGVDNVNGNPLYRVESSSENDNEYVGEWHTDRNDAEKELNSLSKKHTQSLGVVKVIFENPEYNYTTNVGANVTEEEARKYFVGQMFNVGVYPKENMQRAIDIEFSYSLGGFLLGAGVGVLGSYLYNNATVEKDKKGVKIEVKKPKKIFKYGGEIEQRVKDKLSRNFALPFEIVVYVPSTQDADKIISKEEFNKRIVEVETYLAKLFGGFSANPVDGGYNSEDKGLITEDVFKVYSFASRDGFEPKMEELVIQIKEWCKVWGQEAIGLEFEGDLFYVES